MKRTYLHYNRTCFILKGEASPYPGRVRKTFLGRKTILYSIILTFTLIKRSNPISKTNTIIKIANKILSINLRCTRTIIRIFKNEKWLLASY